MNILILGSGGREHSLAWAVNQNPKCDRLIVAPGNAGIAAVADCADIDVMDGAAVVELAEGASVDLVIVGPEAPLAAGVADDLRAAGFSVFGPSAAAAQLEASKAFTHEICDAAGAPMAEWARFSQAGAAKEYVRAQGAPIVVKADGLAAGKGVVVAEDVATACAAIDEMFTIDPIGPVASASVSLSACLISLRATAWLSRSPASRFCCSSSSTELSSTDRASVDITCREAFTRMSTLSKASMVADSRFAIVSFLRRSPEKMRTFCSFSALSPISR